MTEQTGGAIVFCDLIAAAYRPHWTIILTKKRPVPGRSTVNLTAKLVAFDPALGKTYRWVHLPTVQQRLDFETMQNRVTNHLMQIMREPDNEHLLGEIYDILSKYQYRPANDETCNEIKHELNAYWADRIPYDIQTMGQMELEAAVMVPPFRPKYPIHPVYPDGRYDV
ncbi:MAG: hypothetical protein NC114_06750 [Ruminococcus flavefaciens]|nr:hypothetical protein [Ruminococcus flavefaciens]